MSKKPITITDLARSLNVNVSTVSRALNGSSKISEKTKERVLEAAKKHYYRPNNVAANLRKNKGNTIGVLVPLINRNFFSNVIHGIESVLNPAGYNILICSSNENYKKEIAAIDTLISNRVSGIILSVSKETFDDKHIKNIIDNNIAVIQFDRVISNLKTQQVANDNAYGSYLATKHLIDQGYKKIVHFAGRYSVSIYKERIEGFKSALEEYGMSFSDELVFEDVVTEIAGYKKTIEMINSGTIPDAIFAASDYSALGALKAFKEKDISVPNSVGVIGFANEPFTDLVTPRLSSVEQYSVTIGKTAAQTLMNELDNEDLNISKQDILIKTELVLRESSARINNVKSKVDK